MQKKLVTYSQNREDLYIFALLQGQEKGFYVDVGANHAELHSVTKLFYDMGWCGINIEPNPNLYEELKRTRESDTNLKLGISKEKGTLLFREYYKKDGLSTADPSLQRMYESLGEPYKEYNIDVDSLSSVLERHNVGEIDFLKIDVEGHEQQVIEGNDWKKYRPKLVILEAATDHSWKTLLESKGYH